MAPYPPNTSMDINSVSTHILQHLAYRHLTGGSTTAVADSLETAQFNAQAAMDNTDVSDASGNFIACSATNILQFKISVSDVVKHIQYKEDTEFAEGDGDEVGADVASEPAYQQITLTPDDITYEYVKMDTESIEITMQVQDMLTINSDTDGENDELALSYFYEFLEAGASEANSGLTTDGYNVSEYPSGSLKSKITGAWDSLASTVIVDGVHSSALVGQEGVMDVTNSMTFVWSVYDKAEGSNLESAAAVDANMYFKIAPKQTGQLSMATQMLDGVYQAANLATEIEMNQQTSFDSNVANNSEAVTKTTVSTSATAVDGTTVAAASGGTPDQLFVDSAFDTILGTVNWTTTPAVVAATISAEKVTQLITQWTNVVSPADSNLVGLGRDAMLLEVQAQMTDIMGPDLAFKGFFSDGLSGGAEQTQVDVVLPYKGARSSSTSTTLSPVFTTLVAFEA